MYVVGLTGGIGSGKSTVAQYFADLGIDLVDSDIIAREVVAPGSDALQAISAKYGATILQADGTLDRGALRKIVFDSPLERQWLESLTHPRIGLLTEQQLRAANSPYVLFVSPLLLQSGQDKLTQRICVVDLPDDLQLKRASARDNADARSIKKIIATQINRQQRLQRADDVIDNAGTLKNTQAQVSRLHQRYLHLAGSPPFG